MIDRVGVDLLQMMENAGSATCLHIMRSYAPRTVLVLAGGGGNGGGVLAAARHFANRGVAVSVVRSSSKEVDATAQQARILRAMGIGEVPNPVEADLILDGMIGYSLVGEPRSRVRELIEWVATQPNPVVSLDVPSGMDADLGFVHRAAVRPTATTTIALPKPGLMDTAAGEIELIDISVPQSVWQQIGIEVPDNLFGTSQTASLRRVTGGFETSP